MKKILIFIFVLAVFIAQSTAMGWNVYGKFGTGIWWMKTYDFYDDKIPTKVEIHGDTIDTLEYFIGEDPFPLNVSDFLTFGTFGVEAKGDRYKGVIEFGIRINAYDTRAQEEKENQFYHKKFNTAPALKTWYFEWYFNDYLDILAGQDFSPTCFFASNQWFYGGNSLANSGCLYTGRNPMIQFSIHHPEEKWKAKFAVVKIDTTNLRIKNNRGGEDLIGDSTRYYAEVRVPKMESSLEFNVEGEKIGFEFKTAGGFMRYYQIGRHYDVNKFDNGEEEYPVDAYLMGADIKVKLGMFNLVVDGFWGQNVGTFGAYIGDAFGWWFSDWYIFTLIPIHYPDPDYPEDANKYRYLNSKVYEIATILSFKPIENLVFEGGGGTVQGKHEFEEYNAQWHPTYAWYFQTRYKILDMLEITPEVGQVYFGPQFGFGKYTYWGLNSWIEF